MSSINHLQEAAGARMRLSEEMGRWLGQSMVMDPPGPDGGGEDEANYALAWVDHYLVTGDDRVMEHFSMLRDALANWVERDCYHGYERSAEQHHGTEPFLLFVPRLLALTPDDQLLSDLLIDAAHHIGNWEPGVPAWYDYDQDSMVSYWLGTTEVRTEEVWKAEPAEGFRYIHIALAAYEASGDERYLQWALRYGRKRARLVAQVGDGVMPIMWAQDGSPIYQQDLDSRESHWIAKDEHHVQGDPLAGIENLLASGAIYAFGDLYRHSGDEVFKQAALQVASRCVGELLDPAADPAAAAVSYYRYAFDDTSLDGQILDQIRRMPAAFAAERAMIFRQTHARELPGLGKRDDMINWGTWTTDDTIVIVNEPCTWMLTLAYQLTGEVEYAQRALDQAADKLGMARRVLRGGREHADMGGAVCSVAAGHGRNWGHGAVTGAYGSLLLGLYQRMAAMQPIVSVRGTDGTTGLPADTLSLVRPPVNGEGSVLFANAGDEQVTFEYLTDSGSQAWNKVSLAPGEHLELPLSKC